MSMPLPPHLQPREPDPIGPGELHIKMPSGELTVDETAMILRTTLLPEHHCDPNVLRFIASYMRCRNNSQAANDAGLVSRAGYSLRNRPDIHLAITRLTEKSVNKYGFDASEVIEKVKEISEIDPIQFENADGTFKTHMKDIAPEARRAIKKFKAKNFYETDANGMKVLAGQIIEIELWDKMKAVELLGREKDLFKETRKVEHDITSNMAQTLLESSKRAQDRILQLRDAAAATPPVLEIEARPVTEEVPSGG